MFNAKCVKKQTGGAGDGCFPRFFLTRRGLKKGLNIPLKGDHAGLSNFFICAFFCVYRFNGVCCCRGTQNFPIITNSRPPQAPKSLFVIALNHNHAIPLPRYILQNVIDNQTLTNIFQKTTHKIRKAYTNNRSTNAFCVCYVCVYLWLLP